MLSRIVEWYNDIREKSEPCEYKLVEKQIKEIDDELVEGVSKSKWKNYGIFFFSSSRYYIQLTF